MFQVRRPGGRVQGGWRAITAPSDRDAGASSGPQPSACSTMWEAQEQRVGKPPEKWRRRQRRGNFWLWLRRKHKGWGPSNTQGVSRGWQGGAPVIAPPPGDVLGSEEQHIHTVTGGPQLMSRSDPQRRSERHTDTKAPVEVLQTQQVRPSPWVFTRTLEDSTCSIKT